MLCAFYRSQHSEKEEEEEEDEGNEYFDGIESQKVKQMGEGYTSDIESTGRKRSLKVSRSRWYDSGYYFCTLLISCMRMI